MEGILTGREWQITQFQSVSDYLSLGSLEQIKDEFSQSVDEYGRASDDSDSDEFYINMKSEMSRYDEELRLSG